MRIVGYHISNRIVANSDGEHTTEPPFLDFLLQPKPDAIKVFYHLGYNAANLLKLINVTEEEAKLLYTKGKLRLPPYELSYKSTKSRYFSLKKGYYYNNPFASFSDMSQYNAFTPLSEHETVESCIRQAELAKETGETVYNTLVKLGCRPTSLTSPIRVFERDFLKGLGLATVDDIPEDAGLYAYECCSGNWLEAFQLGHWEQVWDYDINSAYPFEVGQLLDLRHGQWKQSKEFVPEAAYGYCFGEVAIHGNAFLSPIIYNKPGRGFESLNYTPTGIWETYLTKNQIAFIKAHKLGEFEIKDGWWWVTDVREKPLEEVVEQLHKHKEFASGLERDVIKRVMSGIFGKFLQKIGGDFGEMFNPVYGAEIEVNTQLKVARLAIAYPDHVLHIAVDGILSDYPIIPNISAETETRMGYWKQTAESPTSCIVAGTGAVAVKGRGLTGEFSLSYDWLKERIEESPEQTEYKIAKQSPVTLAVSQKIEDGWEQLGKLHATTKTVDINGEVKRSYRERPSNGRELLEKHYASVPYDVSRLG